MKNHYQKGSCIMNILNTLTPVSGIYHPQIASMYFKFIGDKEHIKKILIIETQHLPTSMEEEKINTSNLLIDLNDLKKRVEKNIGHFDYIDIRTSSSYTTH